jgi:hypothetical protein
MVSNFYLEKYPNYNPNLALVFWSIKWQEDKQILENCFLLSLHMQERETYFIDWNNRKSANKFWNHYYVLVDEIKSQCDQQVRY